MTTQPETQPERDPAVESTADPDAAGTAVDRTVAGDAAGSGDAVGSGGAPERQGGGAPDGVPGTPATPGTAATSAAREAAERSQRPHRTARDAGARWVATAAAVVIIVAGLRAASAIILPFLVALFVAILSYPLQDRLRRRGVPLAAAVAITIVADLAVLAGAAAVVTDSISDLVRERATYESRLSEYADRIDTQRQSFSRWLGQRGITPPGWLGETRDAEPGETRPGPAAPDGEDLPVVDGSPAQTSWWLQLIDLDAIFGAANRALRGLASAISNILIVVLITTFILLEAASFPGKMARALDDPDVEMRVRKVTRELQRYLGLKTAISLVTGVLVALWVALCGLNSPVLWGFVAFALNYIPNLGSIIAAIPAILFAAVQLGLWPAVAVALGYAAINVVIGNLLEPQILGRRLGLSPLVVFLSLVFWGWVWGPVGMLLSVPITMVVKIALENTRDLRWVALLLQRGVRPPGAPAG